MQSRRGAKSDKDDGKELERGDFVALNRYEDGLELLNTNDKSPAQD